MTHLLAVEQAHETFLMELTKQAQVDRVVALNEFGLFSNRHLSMLTGMRQGNVAAFTNKKDATGGRLTGESLPFIVAAINNRNSRVLDVAVFKQAVDAGASRGMVSRLTGIPMTSVVRYVERATRA